MTTELPRVGPFVPSAARLVVVAIGIAWALVAEAIRLRSNWPVSWVIADLVPGLAFLICGYLAWERRPADRIGPLMICVGFAWYAGTVAVSSVHLIDRAGYALQGYYDALLAWLILAYPTGRLTWRPARVVVGAFFALLIARTIFRWAIFRWTPDLDVRDPLAVDQYVADITLREQGDSVFRILIALVAVAALVLIVARWRSASRTSRGIAGPILLGGIGFAAAIALEAVGLMVPSSFEERQRAWDLGQWLTVVTTTIIPIAFLIGLGQDRLARGRAADLVVELGGADPAPGDLQASVARALGDPSAEVAIARPDTDQLVDLAGRPVHLPQPDDSARMVTRMERDGRTIGAIVHDPALVERSELLASVSAAAGLALENERLRYEVQAQLADVRASRARIVAAGDAERRRVERDLHDGAQQRLVTLALSLQMARREVPTDDPELAAMLDRASQELEGALAELRELARGIHPTALTEDGLATAIETLADRAPVAVDVHVVDRRFEAATESAAYFVVAEALTNVAKYARATTVSVDISQIGDTLRVQVRDDGIGGADVSTGSGLLGLTDRVASVGGRLSIESPVGRGTTIVAEIPCG